MAGSRLHKIGTIFSRATGLMRSGAMKEEDKPLWYDIYKAFPPKLEPRFDRPTVAADIKQIFYPEDGIRAKFYKTFGTPAAINMNNEKQQTISQRFIETYQSMQLGGDINENEVFDDTAERLRSQGVFLGNPKLETDTEETGKLKYSIKDDLATVIPASPVAETLPSSSKSKR